MKFTHDDSGELKEYFESVIAREFEELKFLNFVYVWCEDERTDDDNRVIVCMVRKIGNRDRDIFGYDIAVEASQEEWDKLTEDDKFRIAFHECLHVHVKTIMNDKKIEPKRDKNGRVSFSIKEHDISLKRFKEELIKFGLSGEEKKVLHFLSKVDELHRSKNKAKLKEFEKQYKQYKEDDDETDKPEVGMRKTKVVDIKKGKKGKSKGKKILRKRREVKANG